MADLLSDYETETRRLLHDPTNKYWSTTDLDDYINRARNHVVTDTGCLRTLQQSYLQSGTEYYPFGGVWSIQVTAGGSSYTSAPTVVITPASGDTGVNCAATATLTAGVVTSISVTNPGTLYNAIPTISFTGGGGSGATATAYLVTGNSADVINLTVLWGSQRIVLQGLAFSELNAVGRQWSTYKQRPGLWAMYGAQGLYVAPVPDQPYPVEADTVILPAYLSGTTAGPLVAPFIDGVPYWAAYLAKINEKRIDEAGEFKQLYFQQIAWINNIFTARLQNIYVNNANIE